jgi:hypothetical protein
MSSGPHSITGFVNHIGVPAIVVPAGFYPDGLPFGLQFAARPWIDGDLLGWAFAFEQATRQRRPPTLIESGLLPKAGASVGIAALPTAFFCVSCAARTRTLEENSAGVWTFQFRGSHWLICRSNDA